MAGALIQALQKTVRVIAVDDDQQYASLYNDICACEPFYEIHTAGSAVEAERMLRSSPPFHVCICDLRLFDIGNDQLALVKRFAADTAFVIVTGSYEMQAAFEAGAMHGACGLAVKGSDDSVGNGLLKHVNCCFLKWLFGVIPVGKVRSGLDDGATAFMRHFPSTVQQWAFHRGISPQALSKFYADIRGVEPQFILLLARAYCHAFCAQGLLPDAVATPPPLTDSMEDALCRDLRRHRAVLESVLRGQHKGQRQEIV